MSDSIKPTPGPWHVANGVQIRGEREQIAKVWMMRGGEGKANARLIAAAPDLLEALREIFHDVKQGAIPNDDDEWWKKASTAIAKATGEQT